MRCIRQVTKSHLYHLLVESNYFVKSQSLEGRNVDVSPYHSPIPPTDRFYWSTMDPIVVAEGLFAIANVVSFTRLFYLLAANEQLGPLQISLRRMIGVSVT